MSPTQPQPKSPASLTLTIAQEGELRSFVQLLQPIQFRLFAYAYLMTGRIQDADDCMRICLPPMRQDLRNIGNLGVEAFAIRHLRRAVLATLRTQRFAPPLVPEECGPQILDALDRKDSEALAALTVPLLQALSLEEREAFVLAMALEYSPATVELITDVGASIAEARLKRALIQIRRLARLVPEAKG